MIDNNNDRPMPFTAAHARMLTDIHHALVGVPELGAIGLAERVRRGEEHQRLSDGKIEVHERKFWLVTIIGGAAWASLVAFKESIFGK